MLRVLPLLFLMFFTAPALAQQYQSDELAASAQQYRQELLDAIPPKDRLPARIGELRREADEEFREKRYPAAIGELTRAIGYGADDGLVWLRLAQTQNAAHDDHAMASAYNAYLKSTDPVERGSALVVIGREYDRHDKQKEALAAFQASLALTRVPSVVERIDQLKRLVAFRVVKVALDSDSDNARACLNFNETIGTKSDISYNAFVRTEPALDGVVTARGEIMCLDGLKHGVSYDVEVLPGLPAETGEKLGASFKTRVVVPDRKPSIRFSGTGYVLPREGSAGLPVTTINLDKVKVKLLRVNPRNLVPSMDADRLTMSFASSDVDDVQNRSGSLVWQGEMAISGERNRAVTTAIPLKDMLKEKGPGVYLAVVEQTDAKPDDDTQPATNWVLVSNFGLAAYTGSDSMAVDVRSLADGKPVAGVDLRLFAHNNAELGTGKSDADGVVRFPGGLVRGKGGDEPFAVMAYGADGDFNFLDVGRGAFDLSDRGVSGRPQPGPVDAYLYTERGIYRPGETVELMALVRDDKADAITGLPVTLRLVRPDGVVVDKRQLTDDKLGAHRQSYPLARDARLGVWKVELLVDPKAPAIGSVQFRVEDFVPPQLKVALSAEDKPILPDEEFPVQVDARYYYGAAGADLPVTASARIAVDGNPFPSQPDYQFGLLDEEFNSDSRDIDTSPTDAEGKATVSVSLSDIPAVTRPLAATITVGVAEPSGRTVTETVTRPIRTRPLAIGLHAPSADSVPEGQPMTLDIIAVDDGGKRIAAKGLRWELLRERWQYEWSSQNGVWHSRREVRDTPIETGVIDVGADAPATLSRTLPDGPYRWEVTDTATGAATSLRSEVGWWVEAEIPDVPDKLEATFDKKSYQPGDTAKLFVKAPFAGEGELTIASDKILSMRSVTLPAAGATLEIPVDAAWGGGVYALVSGYRPATPPPAAPNGPPQRGPGRAVGVAWLAIDSTAHRLDVTISPTAIVRPRVPTEIPVKVAGLASGEEAYVTLAAVDEAVLKLTDFDSPAPQDYFFGKRQLGVELRDLYGRLIDPRANGVGVLRSGGDSFASRSVAGLPDKSSKVVALFSGLVRLDGDGNARIHFDIPDFQGQLRLMAVAESAHKVGSAAASMIVRDPVVTLVSLPRFLAPGDNARIGIVINNLEGAAGDYHLKLSGSGAGAFGTPVDRVYKLATGGNAGDGFMLSAATIGNVALKLELSGPNDLKIARDFTVGVRPAQSYQLRRFVGKLDPGQSVRLDDGAADEFLPGTAEALLTVSPRPDWDVPGLLRSLDRYAYGCIEQTTSRALPLLYVDEVADLWRTDAGFSTAEAIDHAIGHIIEMQRTDGSFGVWNDTDMTVPWLDAYATDFLMRAKDRGKNVPDYVLKGAMNWLHDYTRQDHTDAKDLPALAYAHYVLARGKADDLGALRYFNDTEMANLPTQLAKAQLGAALAQYGDAPRAAAAYAAALTPPPSRPPGLRYVDYGSDLRDSAGALSFAATAPGMQPRLTAVMDRITELFARASRTSTQEQAWLLMAADAAVKISGGSMTLAIGTAAPEPRTAALYMRRRLGSGAAPQIVANSGTTPAWRTVSITGVVRGDLPAESKGYTVSRKVYKTDGSAADLTKVRQSDRFIVVVSGERSDAAQGARTLLVDLLPAGFEIENPTIAKGDSATSYSWLPQLSSAAYTEERDDRFIAALDLPGGKRDFTLAYMVRAITPGDYKYPALVVEDMYQPETTGRTAMGKLTVLPR